VFPYRGVYVHHRGQVETVAEANQVVFFNESEPYRVSHPLEGVTLAGKTLKIGEGFFWFRLSNSDKAQTYNLRLANEVSWFDISLVPLVCKNHRRAIPSIEKGASGRKIFEKAFAAW
jgi:hypothetical protein